jgi:hypothetical protein
MKKNIKGLSVCLSVCLSKPLPKSERETRCYKVSKLLPLVLLTTLPVGMSMELWMNGTDKCSKSTRNNICPSCNFSTTNLILTVPELNQGFRWETKTNRTPEPIEAWSVSKFIPYFTENTALSIINTVLLVLLGTCRCPSWKSCEIRKRTVLAKCRDVLTLTQVVHIVTTMFKNVNYLHKYPLLNP